MGVNDQILLWPEGVQAATEQQVGGKAKGLALLEQAGARVPPWFAVSSAALGRLLAETGLETRLRDVLSSVEGPGAKARRSHGSDFVQFPARLK